MRSLILMACVLHVTFAAPQFVTFKDGKIGVNFAGFHASAGLGGLLTGDSAHGGLSASAGTPWGPQAAAGLNGNIDGRASGLAYAGAEASPSVGASAVLGGAAGHHGFVGSEAHANGKVVSNTIGGVGVEEHHPIVPPVAVAADNSNVIQKVKPPKKYTLIKSEHPVHTDATIAHSKQVVKRVYKSTVNEPVPSGGVDVGGAATTGVHVDTGLVGNVLNIPIGILRSLQESLSGIRLDKTLSIAG